jgi:hypothetical protein
MRYKKPTKHGRNPAISARESDGCAGRRAGAYPIIATSAGDAKIGS